MSEELIALKLANYVLDKEMDPDADICILARQFLRKHETVRSLVRAAGDSIFVRDIDIMDGNSDQLELVFLRNEENGGCDVVLRPIMKPVEPHEKISF